MKPHRWGLRILKPTSLLCGAEILWEEVQKGSGIKGDASIVRYETSNTQCKGQWIDEMKISRNQKNGGVEASPDTHCYDSVFAWSLIGRSRDDVISSYARPKWVTRDTYRETRM